MISFLELRSSPRGETMPKLRSEKLMDFMESCAILDIKARDVYKQYRLLQESDPVEKDTRNWKGFANLFYEIKRKHKLNKKINPRFIATEVQKFISSHPKFKFKLHNVSADVLNINTNDETYVITVKPNMKT